jgi:hypothetical protein
VIESTINLNGGLKMGQGVLQNYCQHRIFERRVLLGAFALAITFALTIDSRAQASETPHASGAETAQAAEPPIQSGVYGFSGGKVPYGDPEGVVGECIWIFDEHNKSQVAKGECAERTPGKFRVVLKPGRYVVHGPGGNRAVEIKHGQWVKIESIVALPLAP